jgi:carbon-monoxide dehydrogenase large subunit
MAMTGSLLGTRVERREDHRLLSGEAKFVADLEIDGMLTARFVRSPVAHGLIDTINVADAAALPGVVAVHTAATLGLGPLRGRFGLPHELDPHALATDKVRYVGEPVALVIAETEAAAIDASEVVIVDYEPLPAQMDAEAAHAGGGNAIHPQAESDVIAKDFGEVAELHAEDAVSAHARIENNRMAVVPLEGHAIAVVPESDGTLTAWVGTQGVHTTRDGMAAGLGIEPDQLRVIAPAVGGGFGGKSGTRPEHVAVAQAARLTGRPVRWVEQRSENLVSMQGRHQIQHGTLSFDKFGRITSLEGFVLADAGGQMGVGAILPMATRMMAKGVYEIPKLQVDYAAVATNRAPLGAFRGAGRPQASAMIERLMDIGAAELGMDPIELRLLNMIPENAFPYDTGLWTVYDCGDYAFVLKKAAELVGYDGLRRDQELRRAGNDPNLLGIGVACYVEITGGFGPDEFASVDFDTDGVATVKVGTASHGQGHETTFVAIVADRLGVELEDVRFVNSDTAAVARGDGTGGSRSAQVGGSAVLGACDAMIDRARELAASLLEANPDDIVVTGDGGVGVAGVPASSLSWGELATAATDAGDSQLLAEFDFHMDGSTFPFGAHIAVVEVDRETGAVELLRHVAVDDCGTILNPMIVEGQQHGGMAAGISQALYEEIVYDADGNPLTTNLADYAMPSAAEFPNFETYNTETPTPLNPLGAKGIGESGSVGSTPAVQNAVVDALAHLGVRHVDMPLTPEKVWRAVNS